MTDLNRTAGLLAREVRDVVAALLEEPRAVMTAKDVLDMLTGADTLASNYLREAPAVPPAPAPLIEPPKHNCFTCRFSRPDGTVCNRLTLDEDEDKPILDWAESFGGFLEGGAPPKDADGCPCWVLRYTPDDLRRQWRRNSRRPTTSHARTRRGSPSGSP